VTVTTVIAVVVALVLAQMIAHGYDGESYVCPVCGTNREDQHADECPWKRGS